LDDDSILLKPVKYDVFKFMKKHSLCITDTYTFFGMLPKWPDPRIYYNNFQISNTEMWMSEKYKNYINYIDKFGGPLYHRWGDAPIHGIAVSLFLHKNQTHHFKDIGYQHVSFINSGS
jgi:hypothetical protein